MEAVTDTTKWLNADVSEEQMEKCGKLTTHLYLMSGYSQFKEIAMLILYTTALENEVQRLRREAGDVEFTIPHLISVVDEENA